MNFEQIALLGIGVFVFMALVAMFNTARSIKKVAKGSVVGRARRLISSPEPASAVARSVVTEVRDEYDSEVAIARKTGTQPPALEQALAEAEDYFLLRVEPRYRVLFSKAVSEIIYEEPLDKKESSRE